MPSYRRQPSGHDDMTNGDRAAGGWPRWGKNGQNIGIYFLMPNGNGCLRSGSNCPLCETVLELISPHSWIVREREVMWGQASNPTMATSLASACALE